MFPLIPDPTDPLKLSGSPMIRSIGSGIRTSQGFARDPLSMDGGASFFLTDLILPAFAGAGPVPG